MNRERLTNRRASDVLSFNHVETTGMETPYVATVGFYDDGRIGEVFLDAPKNQSALGILCHDAAVIISIALQHGATIAELQSSVARTKLEGGLPQSVIGSTLDLLALVEREST